MSTKVALLMGLLAPLRVSMPERADCPSAQAVEDDIAALIGVSPPPPVDVQLRIEDVAEGVVADLAFESGGRSQTRRIPGATCSDVVNAAAVVVAVGVDPVSVGRTLAPVLQRPSPSTPATPPAPTPRVPPATAHAIVASHERSDRQPAAARSDPPPTRRLHVAAPLSLHAFAAGGPTVGLFPSVSGWLGGGLALHRRALRLEWSGQHQFGRQIDHPQAPNAGVVASVTSGRASGCWSPRVGAFSLSACGGAELGAALGRGRGLEAQATARVLWAAVTPGARVHWRPAGPLAVGLLIDVPISVLRPGFAIDDLDQRVTQLGPAALWVGLGFEVRLFERNPS